MASKNLIQPVNYLIEATFAKFFLFWCKIRDQFVFNLFSGGQPTNIQIIP